MAAKAALRMRVRVLVIDNTQHVGGIFTSGLGTTDSYYHSTIGGLAHRFFLDLGKYYGLPPGQPQYLFEPHVAEAIFNDYLGVKSVSVLLGRTIQSVQKNGTKISSITLDDGTTVQGRQWIDASYEGDLMAKAGATHVIGRESSAQFSESFAGWGFQQSVNVSPYLPDGSLIPGLIPNPGETNGQGDGNIMAYSFRNCLTSDKSNSMPFPMPVGYSADQFVGTSRYIQAVSATQLSDVLTLESTVNNKFTLLNTQFFSTDYPNACLGYPDGDWNMRASIWTKHYNYLTGLLYFLANDPSVPASIRSQMNLYGLPLDEFTDNNHWPWQMYVREGRRLQGKYIMTQADLISSPTKQDAVAIGLWAIDSHVCAAFASSMSGQPVVMHDGAMYQPVYTPYQLPFGSILPNPSEVSNLAVTACLSSSHIAFCSLRVEPTFMVLGEAAGAAAGLALEENVDLSAVNVTALQNLLAEAGAVIKLP